MTMKLSPVAVMGVAIASGILVLRYVLDSAVAFVHRHSVTLVDILSKLVVCRQSRKPE